MREDYGLPALMRYENIAWYENGTVRMLDRRVYPAETRYVVCRDYGEVASAVTGMVTQSYGPFHAAAMGMVLAANACGTQPEKAQRAFLKCAADAIATARPTTERKMRIWTDAAEAAASRALDAGENARDAILTWALDQFDRRYAKIAQAGAHLAKLVPEGGTVMTQCYADADLGMLLRALRESGKAARFVTPETRPYLQGARLTASAIFEMGFDVTLITDNMPCWAMEQLGVDLFTSAADLICMDGHVVNKVGTLQIALSARYQHVPYYVSGFPDRGHPGRESVRIEQRDPDEVLYAMGVRTCMQGVHGWYPAFDITPPELVSGVVTDQGVLPPDGLDRYRF